LTIVIKTKVNSYEMTNKFNFIVKFSR